MNIEAFENGDRTEVTSLFKRVFSDSEGEQEGNAIAALVTELIDTTQASDLQGYVAIASRTTDQIIASIFFSVLKLENDKKAYLLSPVAVESSEQGKGVGQALIQFGLEKLKSQGVEYVITYGDPAFYSKVGFESLSEDVIPAPYKLSMPQGWLINNLQGADIEVLPSPIKCVSAFNNPHLW